MSKIVKLMEMKNHFPLFNPSESLLAWDLIICMYPMYLCISSTQAYGRGDWLLSLPWAGSLMLPQLLSTCKISWGGTLIDPRINPCLVSTYFAPKDWWWCLEWWRNYQMPILWESMRRSDIPFSPDVNRTCMWSQWVSVSVWFLFLFFCVYLWLDDCIISSSPVWI